MECKGILHSMQIIADARTSAKIIRPLGVQVFQLKQVHLE